MWEGVRKNPYTLLNGVGVQSIGGWFVDGLRSRIDIPLSLRQQGVHNQF